MMTGWFFCCIDSAAHDWRQGLNCAITMVKKQYTLVPTTLCNVPLLAFGQFVWSTYQICFEGLEIGLAILSCLIHGL